MNIQSVLLVKLLNILGILQNKCLDYDCWKAALSRALVICQAAGWFEYAPLERFVMNIV